MKRLVSAAAGLLCLFFAFNAAAAGERATPEQAEALVKKAVEYYRTHDHAAALAEFARKDGPFIRGDLYINTYDMRGKCLSHINERMIGKDMITLRDPDGVYIIKDRIERARKQGQGWQEYKFFNPSTHKIEPKHMYFEKVGDVIVAAGAYKPGHS